MSPTSIKPATSRPPRRTLPASARRAGGRPVLARVLLEASMRHHHVPPAWMPILQSV